MRSREKGSTTGVQPFAMILLAGICVSACDKAPNLRGRIAGLEQISAQAERDGALRCAPRELALSRAYTQFAQMELRKGSVSQAEDYVRRAELNAKAAQLQSPREHCADHSASGPDDRDGDGYPNKVDSCPDEAEIFQGFEDHDGCPDDPDTDGDGIPDSLDACTLSPEDIDQYLDEDGCPDLDNDFDTIPDRADGCPLEPEDIDGYEDQDGCPELDNDHDTVPDVSDECPNTPGQTESDPIGCPIKPALVVVTDCEVKILEQIHFDYNKASIKRDSYPVLDAVFDVLTRNPSIQLEVQGHTDSRGSDSYNRQLSDQRASAVLQYLVSRGIGPDRLQSNGYGEERPIVENDTDTNRALNRRVQFIRTEGQKEGCGLPAPKNP